MIFFLFVKNSYLSRYITKFLKHFSPMISCCFVLVFFILSHLFVENVLCRDDTYQRGYTFLSGMSWEKEKEGGRGFYREVIRWVLRELRKSCVTERVSRLWGNHFRETKQVVFEKKKRAAREREANKELDSFVQVWLQYASYFPISHFSTLPPADFGFILMLDCGH